MRGAIQRCSGELAATLAATSVPVIALIVMMLAALAGGAARAQDGEAPQYFGAPGGWSFRAGGADASASTLLLSREMNGLILLFCEQSRIGFHISTRTTDRRSLAGRDDGLLQIYPHEPEASGSPVAQFRIRFFSDAEFRSAHFVQPGGDDPARLLQVIRDHASGMRLVVVQLNPGRLREPQSFDLYLPEGTDGSGLPMETALAFLERDCRTGLRSDSTIVEEPTNEDDLSPEPR